MISSPRSFFPSDGQVLPAIDLRERPLGPVVDGVKQAHEEVDGERADVDLVLQRCPPFQELMSHGAAEAKHLLGLVTHLLERGDDLLLRAEWRDEEPDHRLEIHRER